MSLSCMARAIFGMTVPSAMLSCVQAFASEAHVWQNEWPHVMDMTGDVSRPLHSGHNRAGDGAWKKAASEDMRVPLVVLACVDEVKC